MVASRFTGRNLGLTAVAAAALAMVGILLAHGRMDVRSVRTQHRSRAEPRPNGDHQHATLAGDPPQAVTRHAAIGSAQVRGVVVDADGTPITGVLVQLQESASLDGPEMGASSEQRTDTAGGFALPARTGLRYELSATFTGYVAVRRRGVCAGQVLRVVLRATTSLLVRVLAPDGGPAGDATVRAYYRGDQPLGSADGVTGPEGLCHLDAPRGSKCTVFAQHDVFGSSAATAWIGSEPERCLELTLPGGLTLRGTVFDCADGRGVSGASIRATGQFGAGVSSDASGRFTLPGWSPQTHDERRLLVRAVGYAPASVQIADEGENVQVCLRHSVALVGSVVGTDGAPVAAAEVRASVWSRSDRAWVPTGRAKSGGDGAFRVEGAAPGDRCLVEVGAPLLGQLSVEAPLPPDAPPEWVLPVLRMETAGTIEGTVLGAGDAPCVDTVVALVQRNSDVCDAPYVSEGPRARSGDASSYTDSTGAFRFEGLGVGAYRVVARVPGAPYVAQEVHVRSGQVARVELRTCTTPGKPIDVRVLTSIGEPLPECTVAVQTSAGIYGVTTDLLGRARVFLADDSRLVIVDPGATDGGRWMREELAASQARGKQEIEVTLRPRRSIRGLVVTEGGGRVAGVGVDLVQADGERIASTWTTGSGVFDLGCPAGTPSACRLVLRSERMQVAWGEILRSPSPWQGEARVPSDGAGQVRVVARRAPGCAAIRVRVYGPSGEPASGALVILRGREGSFPWNGVTDDSGTCRFDGIPTGSDLMASARPPPETASRLGHLDAPAVPAVAGRELELSLRFEQAIRLEVSPPREMGSESPWLLVQVSDRKGAGCGGGALLFGRVLTVWIHPDRFPVSVAGRAQGAEEAWYASALSPERGADVIRVRLSSSLGK